MSGSDLAPDDELVATLAEFRARVGSIEPYFNALVGIPYSEDDDDEGLDEGSALISDSESGLRLGVQRRSRRGVYEFRYIATVVHETYRFVADVAVRVETAEEVRPTVGAHFEYAVHIALPAAYPYIREALDSLASRFRLEPLNLPVLDFPESLKYDEADADEAMSLDD